MPMQSGSRYNRTVRTSNLFLFLCFIVSAAGFAQVTYNAYAMVTSIGGSTLLAVSNVNETNHTFTAGGQVIVMQMQDDVIGTNTANASSFGNLGSIANAGRFEVANISAVNRSSGTATSIALSSTLANTYNTGSNSRVQVISFRQLNSGAFTTTAAITGAAWNGSVGGVIALQVGTDFTISHSITANGLGFRGGAVSANYYGGGTVCTTIDYATSSTQSAYKGEGIYAVTSGTRTNGIAKIINGGGGGGQDINGGGGGGGNFTAGGAGGYGWNSTTAGCSSPGAGGTAGVTLSASIGPSRVFMGGGGGGGQQNNSVGIAGGNGGGIILIKANRIITGGCSSNPTITSNGSSTSGTSIDGIGGAGAGGSIVMQVNSYSVSAGCPLTVMANGGSGGSITNSQGHAGGAAGGQGVVIYSIAQPTTNITTQTNNGTAGCSNSGCSVSAGSAAGTSNGGIVASSSGVLPVELIEFEAYLKLNHVMLDWTTASERNANYFLVKRSTDGLNWSTVDKVAAHGTCKVTHRYSGIDYNPPGGTVYYRLTTVDFDLSEQISPLKSIDVKDGSPAIVLFPNPANGFLTVALSEAYIENSIEIVDVTGRQMATKLVENLDNKLLVDISGLGSGVYYVSVTYGTLRKIARLIVQ